MSGLTVERSGFLTTVQDLGRPGHAAEGISASGAADPIALTVANRLVGNEPGAAALEMTLVGGAFRFESAAVVALSGADTGARIDGRDAPVWEAFAVRAGETLACGALHGGARAYLSVAGGLAVPLLLGSASTHLLTGLGGVAGRALRSGDRIPVHDPPHRAPAGRAADPAAIPSYRTGDPLRVTPGPQASWFDGEAAALLSATAWRVTEACDRMGIRLEGACLSPREVREMTTEGVPLGAVQVPPSGEPIVLFVEHQTTGGYPKIAAVIAADLPRLGGLRPRDAVRFETVSVTAAHALLREQREALDALFD